jgi:hypothetical protein
MNDFSFDEMLLMYDVLVKSIVVLASNYSEKELEHYNSLRQKLYVKLQERTKS